MNTTRTYRTLTSLVCIALVAMPSPSFGFCSWFHKKTPAPAVAACNPCGVQQTVSYVPQTCYRTQFVTVPVTTYRPATTVDPCTGCRTSVMRPVIAYVQQKQIVPYTTYRPMVSNACFSCAPAATTTYAPVIPAAAPMVPAAAPCATCGVGAAAVAPPAGYAVAPAVTAPAMSAPMMSAPAGTAPAVPGYAAPQIPSYTAPGGTSYAAPAIPTYTNPSPSPYTAIPTAPLYATPPSGVPASAAPSIGPPTGAPSLSPTPGAPAAPSTQQNLKPDAPKPVPDPNVINQPAAPRATPSSIPRLIDPDTRTTARPIYEPWASSPVNWPEQTPVRTVSATVETRAASADIAPIAPLAPVDTDGWRPSQR